jgi:hypothetical protein
MGKPVIGAVEISALKWFFIMLGVPEWAFNILRNRITGNY